MLRTLRADLSLYQVQSLLYPLSEIPCGPKEPEVRGSKLEVVHLSSKARREHGTRGRSSEESHEELLDPLCVKTTTFSWWVGGCLHAKRTAIGEVVVVEEGRSQVDHQIAITNRTEPCQAPTSLPWTTTSSTSTTEYALC